MAAASVQEIITGSDEDSKSTTGADGEAEDVENVQDELWLKDLDLGNKIFGIVAICKTSMILVIWFLYYWNGSGITSYYWWTWFTALLAVGLPWGPVAISYIWQLSTGYESPAADTWFYYTSQISIIGPMVGYFAPLVVLALAYNEKKETGLQFQSKTHFWLGWFFGVFFTVLSIIFEFGFLPGIRIWYDLKSDPDKYVQTEEEQEQDDPNVLVIPDEPIEEEETNDEITTFFTDFKHNVYL